jgi:hypothetical protein
VAGWDLNSCVTQGKTLKTVKKNKKPLPSVGGITKWYKCYGK